MKIDLSQIDTKKFSVITKNVSGEDFHLVIPHRTSDAMFGSWNENNLHFRSSVWTSDGELVSASYKKFFNVGENPNIDPINDHSDLRFYEKLDGSTLIVSRFRETMLVRTRSTIDARASLSNSDELTDLMHSHPAAFDVPEGFSYLYEWISPSNVIVIRKEKPELHLTCVVRHEDYTYLSQKEITQIAAEKGLSRPREFTFKDLADSTTTVKSWRDSEGVCVYYNSDQSIRKAKSDWYLELHAAKSSLTNERIIDLVLLDAVKDLDHECQEYVRVKASLVRDAINETKLKVEKVVNFVSGLSGSQKEKALIIQERFSGSELALAFAASRSKPLEKITSSMVRDAAHSKFNDLVC